MGVDVLIYPEFENATASTECRTLQAAKVRSVFAGERR